jgi:hypothetical protein
LLCKLYIDLKALALTTCSGGSDVISEIAASSYDNTTPAAAAAASLFVSGMFGENGGLNFEKKPLSLITRHSLLSRPYLRAEGRL